MFQNSASEFPHAQRAVDAPPPPYTESSSDARSGTSTPTSSIVSLPGSRPASPTPPPVQAAEKAAPPRQPVASPREPVAPLREQAAPPHLPAELPHRPAAPSEEVRVTLPADLQRAIAPLQVRRKNTSISGNFLVLNNGSGESDAPEVSLRTSNSSIKSTVYVEASDWARPVTIEAWTVNSSIALAVRTLQSGQPVDIQATTENSSNSVLLPRDFKGLLVLATINSKMVLSPELQRVSVRIPSQHRGRNYGVDLSFPKSSGSFTDDDMEWYQINGADGPSRAIVKSKNSKVSAGLVGEEFSSGGSSVVINGSSSCIVM